MKHHQDTILIVDSVSKSFAKNANDRSLRVLDDLDILVPQNKITALIGGNGTGKTTLFNIVSGLCPADEGQIIYHTGSKSTVLNKLKPYQISRLGIGRLFQTSHVFENLSILENLLLGHCYGKAELPFYNMLLPKQLRSLENGISTRAHLLLESLFENDSYFWDRRHDLAQQLSYGQKRILEIMRLLMGDYKLLLLDEPTAGVSPQLCNVISTILRKIVTEHDQSIFLIEHNMRFVMDTSDICHFIYQGRDQRFGTPQDVLSDAAVRHSYMGI
jgi:ABC-type branched-subunit amino acid transport system ATPase component